MSKPFLYSGMNFSALGVIGKSGKWYACEHGYHLATMRLHSDDAPFVEVKADGSAKFEAYYTAAHTVPTRAQFEALIAWCTARHEVFEDAIDCWDDPWQDYK